MRYISIVFFLIVCANANASREERIQVLMEAQNTLSIFKSSIENSKSQVKKMADESLSQIMSGLNPSNEYKEKFTSAFNKLISETTNIFTAEEIVAQWSELYGKQFTDEEIEQLIKFYTSPLGKKDVQSSQIALQEFNKIMSEKILPIFKNSLSAYTVSLKEITKQCKCPK